MAMEDDSRSIFVTVLIFTACRAVRVLSTSRESGEHDYSRESWNANHQCLLTEIQDAATPSRHLAFVQWTLRCAVGGSGAKLLSPWRERRSSDRTNADPAPGAKPREPSLSELRWRVDGQALSADGRRRVVTLGASMRDRNSPVNALWVGWFSPMQTRKEGQ